MYEGSEAPEERGFSGEVFGELTRKEDLGKVFLEGEGSDSVMNGKGLGRSVPVIGLSRWWQADQIVEELHAASEETYSCLTPAGALSPETLPQLMAKACLQKRVLG